MYITKKSVYRHLIIPLKKEGHKIDLVGSISYKGWSDKDIDLVINLPKYIAGNNLNTRLYKRFEKDLQILKWEYDDSYESDKYGLVHHWYKNGVGLDVFINEDY